MALTLSDNGGEDFQPVPEGTHIARCVRVIDLGLQPGSQQYPEPRHKVLLGWEIPDEIVTIDGEDRPALIMSRYTASLHKKAGLRSLLESWRGRTFTEDELRGWSLRNILDVPCMLTVIHTTKDGRIYANVKSVAKIPKGFTAPARVTEPIWYEIEHGQNEVYWLLSDKMRAAIDIGAGREPVASPPSPPAEKPAYDPRGQRNGEVKAIVAATSNKPPVVVDYAKDDSVPF